MGELFRNGVDDLREDHGITTLPLIFELIGLGLLLAGSINKVDLVFPTERDFHNSAPHGVVLATDQDMGNDHEPLCLRRMEIQWGNRNCDEVQRYSLAGIGVMMGFGILLCDLGIGVMTGSGILQCDPDQDECYLGTASQINTCAVWTLLLGSRQVLFGRSFLGLS